MTGYLRDDAVQESQIAVICHAAPTIKAPRLGDFPDPSTNFLLLYYVVLSTKIKGLQRRSTYNNHHALSPPGCSCFGRFECLLHRRSHQRLSRKEC